MLYPGISARQRSLNMWEGPLSARLEALVASGGLLSPEGSGARETACIGRYSLQLRMAAFTRSNARGTGSYASDAQG